ncbi:hypothetical protein GF406_04800 [candidate division KSB1 bacterium]|jgi:hypothetical protein|nr:hypothetical protein [candidate division KSB1 bacterium]
MHKNEQAKRWVATWQKADLSLRSIKIMELRNKDYYLKNRDILNNMLQYAFDKQTVRVFSGLVIQQNIFKTYYSKHLRALQ